MELKLKGNKKSIDTLLKKNKRFIEKYEIEVVSDEPKKNIKEVIKDESSKESDIPKRVRRTKAQIEADKKE